MTNGFTAGGGGGPGVHVAAQQANAALSGIISQQAYVAAFDDASLALAIAGVVMLALIPVFDVKRSR